jgi:uncharacterized protein YcnI
MLRRLPILAALAAAILLLLAGPAGAHVDLEPGEATAGSTTTLTFSFHHGKDGTATTGFEVLLPAGTSVVEIPAVAGWASELNETEGVVTWSGGSSPDGVETRFPLVVTLPATPGEVLFKTIQTTEAGELAWIEEDDDGEGENSSPAPRLMLVTDPNATTTTEPSTATTAGVTTSTTDDDTLPGTTLEAAARDDGTTSAAPWLIGSGVAAAVVVVAGGAVLKRRAG